MHTPPARTAGPAPQESRPGAATLATSLPKRAAARALVPAIAPSSALTRGPPPARKNEQVVSCISFPAPTLSRSPPPFFCCPHVFTHALSISLSLSLSLSLHPSPATSVSKITERESEGKTEGHTHIHRHRHTGPQAHRHTGTLTRVFTPVRAFFHRSAVSPAPVPTC